MMLYGELNAWRKTPCFLLSETWKKAFIWLEQNKGLSVEGYYNLGVEGFYARVMKYALKERSQARYEMHRQTYDIQCTVSGAEGIELASVQDLDPINDYSSEKDVEHYITPVKSRIRIDNMPGCFVIISPFEPHMPQLKIENVHEVVKIVVKVPEILLIDGFKGM